MQALFGEKKLTYFADFGVLEGETNVILIDFRLFCNVSAKPTNGASGTFRDGSSCATSGASILFMKLTYYQNFGVLGGEKSVILIDFRLFCKVLTTPTNRASGALRDGSSCAISGASILRIKLTYFEDFGVLGDKKLSF